MCLHRRGETRKPTSTSMTCRAYCEYTRGILIRVVGGSVSTAFRTADSVISRKSTRRVATNESPNTAHMCAAMASPSRSSSDAIITFSLGNARITSPISLTHSTLSFNTVNVGVYFPDATSMFFKDPKHRI